MKGITIDRDENYAEMEISSVFYPREVIEETTNEFRDICNFRIEKRGERTAINFTPKADVPIEILTYEFVNHLLANLKNRRGVM